MGKRGPPPTPTPILKIRGSREPKRQKRNAEPIGPAGRPVCPGWLDARAKTLWKQLVPLLEQMQILTLIDSQALARYCRLWSRWRRAEEFIEKNGEVYPLKDEAGRIRCVMTFPQVGIAKHLAQQLMRLEQEFGMTPSARSRVRVEAGASGTEDPLSVFLRRG